MEQNNIKKYLTYAIGEIFLVVIGILIALQINNWNTNRLLEKKEHAVLLSLKADFEATADNLDQTIHRQTLVVDYSRKLMQAMHLKDTGIPSDSLGEYLYRGAYSYWRIEPVNGTYDALIGSGNTGIIQNQQLLQLLTDFSTQIKFGFEDETLSLNLTGMLIDKSSTYSAKLFPLALKRSNEWIKDSLTPQEAQALVEEHIANDSFSGVLIMKNGMERNRLAYQKKVKRLSAQITEVLNKELKRFQ